MTRFEIYICAWIEVFEGLVQVISFTLIPHPWWTFKYTAWASQRNIKEKLKKNPPQNLTNYTRVTPSCTECSNNTWHGSYCENHWKEKFPEDYNILRHYKGGR